MKKVILISLIVMLIFPSNSFALQDKKEGKLVQKQLEIYESKRELENVYNQIGNIENSLPKIKKSIDNQKIENKKVREKIKPMLVAMQQRDPNYHLTMLLAADNFWEVIQISELLIIAYENQKDILEKYINKEEKLNDMLRNMKYKESHLNKLKKYHIDKLEKLGFSEVELENELKNNKNSENIKKAGEELVKQWENEGLKTFELFFSSLSKTMNTLPNHFDKRKIKTVGFFKRSVSIEETEINNMLKKDKLLENVKVKFKPNQLIVYGYYNDTSLIIFGKYTLTKEHNLIFKIEKILFNGYELPEFTIEQMEDKYDLGFYPKKIIKGVQIKDFKIKKKKIEVKVGVK